MDEPYPSFHVDLFCRNPVCPKGKKRFQSERALTMHFTKSPLCRRFLRSQANPISVLDLPKNLNSHTKITYNISSDVKHIPQHLRRNHINMSYPGYDNANNQHNDANNDFPLSTAIEDDFVNNQTTNICAPCPDAAAMNPVPEAIGCDHTEAQIFPIYNRPEMDNFSSKAFERYECT